MGIHCPQTSLSYSGNFYPQVPTIYHSRKEITLLWKKITSMEPLAGEWNTA